MKENNNHLAIYLNDHLAGSTGVLNLLERLPQTKAGKKIEDFLVQLRGDIIADRLTLEALIQRAQGGTRPHPKAAGWLAERMSFKLRLDDEEDGVDLLEALELLQVGIEGKRALWCALAEAAENSPPLQGVNFRHLIQRAQEQHRRVEAVRVETARAALAEAA